MNRKLIRQRKEYLFEKEKEMENKKLLAKRNSNEEKDCEYNKDFDTDTKILLTTSRNPSSRLKQFHKELQYLFPNSINVNRGAYKIKDIYELGITQGFTDVALLHEHRGEPDGLILSHLPVGPTVYFGLTNAVLRHDADEGRQAITQALPHLIFENFNEEKIGKRFKTILQNLFPVMKKEESKRIVTFAGDRDFISVRHHSYEKLDYNTIDLTELGPRFELRPYMIKLGNLLQGTATIEWSLKSHINTAKKNKQISEK